jgi:hypothetical protein
MNTNESITCIHLPGSLESIAFGAFECCDKLSIHLPNSVSYLEGGFCLGAVSITVDGDNPRYSVQDGFLVDKKNAVLLHKKFEPIHIDLLQKLNLSVFIKPIAQCASVRYAGSTVEFCNKAIVHGRYLLVFC